MSAMQKGFVAGSAFGMICTLLTWFGLWWACIPAGAAVCAIMIRLDRDAPQS